MSTQTTSTQDAQFGLPAVIGRLRGLHGDRQGQIIVLVFFLGMAFFTSVLMVVNTGRVVNLRIENQNAVDAAAVSGAASMARGMNYLSSNNLAQGRVLSVVIVLRAFKPAIEAGLLTLDGWKIVVQIMRTTAAALKSNPWTVAAGVALDIAATILDIKIQVEEAILEAMKEIINEAFDWFDEGISSQDPQDTDGLAWGLLKGFSVLGKVLAWYSPLVAQYTAQAVYRQNLSPAGGFGFALLLPLYPGMPVCQGGFKKFQVPLADEPCEFVDELARPIRILGWVVLTLSLWPLYFELGVNVHMMALFQGMEVTPTVPQSDEDQKKMAAIDTLMNEYRSERDQLELEASRLGVLPDSDLPGGELPYKQRALEKAIDARDNPDPGDADSYGSGLTEEREEELKDKYGKEKETSPQDKIDQLTAEVDALEQSIEQPGGHPPEDIKYWRVESPRSGYVGGEMGYHQWRGHEEQAKLDALEDQIQQKKGEKSRAGTAAERAAIQIEIDALEAQAAATQVLIQQHGAAQTQIQWDLYQKKARIDWLDGEIDRLQREMDELAQQNTEPPDEEPGKTQVTKEDEDGEHDLDDEIYPYLLDAEGWPRTFSVYVVAGRECREPLGSSKDYFRFFGDVYQNKMPLGFAYAGARVFTSSSADLWTSDWRAKLVRVRLDELPEPAELLGRFPGKCGEQDSGQTGTDGASPQDLANQALSGSDMGGSGENENTLLQKVSGVLDWFNKH